MSFSLDQLLIFAANAGNRALAEDRLAQGADPNYLDSRHGSAAMAAVRRGDSRILTLLLDAGLEPDRPAALGLGGLIEGALHYQQQDIAALLTHRGFRLLPHARFIYRERLRIALAEHARVEPGAAPNGGPAALCGSSEGTERPPSVT